MKPKNKIKEKMRKKIKAKKIKLVVEIQAK